MCGPERLFVFNAWTEWMVYCAAESCHNRPYFVYVPLSAFVSILKIDEDLSSSKDHP